MRGQRRCIVSAHRARDRTVLTPTSSTAEQSAPCTSSLAGAPCVVLAHSRRVVRPQPPLPAVSACRKRDVEGASHSLTNGIMIHLGGFVPVDETSLETRWLVIMTWEPGVKLYWAASDTIGGTREK